MLDVSTGMDSQGQWRVAATLWRVNQRKAPDSVGWEGDRTGEGASLSASGLT